jgi:hypothetical protein
MGNVGSQQIDIRSGGNFSTLESFLDKRYIVRTAFSETVAVTVTNANVSLLSTANVGVLSLAVDASTTAKNNALMSAKLAGAVGTGALTVVSDSYGNYLNLVELRDATTHDALYTSSSSSGRKIYGLMQCASTVSDGNAVGGVGSENIQISFFYVTSAGVMTLVNVNGAIEMQLPKVFSRRFEPTISLECGSQDAEFIIGGGGVPDIKKMVVTADFAVNEVINLTTGAGGVSGTSTVTGATIALDVDAPTFNGNNSILVQLNGVELEKGVGVVWDSTNTFHIPVALYVGDVVVVKQIPS